MKLVEIENLEEVAIIKLNRPDSLNALNLEMTKSLIEILENIKENSNIKVVILKGNGRAFSAGVDLKNTDSSGFDKEGEMMLEGRKLCELVAGLSKITIAQVHGYCFTGALELMLCFDLVYCTPETQFGDTHAKFGIMPRWGMTQRLPRKVGVAKAKEMSFRAMRVKGDEAERIGLVNGNFSMDNLDAEVLKISKEITENNFKVLKVVKNLIDRGLSGPSDSLEYGLKIESLNDETVENLNESIQGFGK